MSMLLQPPTSIMCSGVTRASTRRVAQVWRRTCGLKWMPAEGDALTEAFVPPDGQRLLETRSVMSVPCREKDLLSRASPLWVALGLDPVEQPLRQAAVRLAEGHVSRPAILGAVGVVDAPRHGHAGRTRAEAQARQGQRRHFADAQTPGLSLPQPGRLLIPMLRAYQPWNGRGRPTW
jgi:hypothetical protein